MSRLLELCPCGSGRKAAKCCLRHARFKGFREPKTKREAISCMTVRQKNLLFASKIAQAMQLDELSRPPGSFQEALSELKRALTPSAVREIHLAIPEIWPDLQDLRRCLLDIRGISSGVFTGDYTYKTTLRLVNRHALYDTNIILIDPFIDYRAIRNEFNPVIQPEQHVGNTLHYVLWWLSLVPWIEEGIISVIPDPGNLDPMLMISSLKSAEERGSALADALESEIENIWATQGKDDFKSLRKNPFVGRVFPTLS